MGKTKSDDDLNVIIGKKFGRLTPVEMIREKRHKYNEIFYKCNCDCGKINHMITRSNLLKGTTTSCGCKTKELIYHMGKDLTGMRFGRLTAINKTHHPDKKGGFWNCLCDCGEYKLIKTGSLTCGNAKSCGCLHKEISAKNIVKYNRNFNTYDLSGEYAVGFTKKEEEFYFNLEDYDRIKDYCWYLNGNGYPTAKINNVKVFMHKLLLNATREDIVDHINRNRTDNRIENLRICTKSDNNVNINKRKDNSSGVTGVSWDDTHNIWIAMLQYKYKVYKTYHNNKIDAIKSRLLMELDVLGYDFAPQKHLFKQYGINVESNKLNEEVKQ